jgi:hydrogenase small subunit
MTLGEKLALQGVTRRTFLKYCTSLASLMALPPAMAAEMAEKLAKSTRQPVIWLSFQECTGCTESIARSHSPTLESLIFDAISLDYHHTLQAASGGAAEAARLASMKEHYGKYILVVDGAIPMKDGGVYSTIAGISNYDMLIDTAKGAAAIIAAGTCAAYGGLPHANPNPTGAVSVSDIVKDKPIINVPGCPPIATVMTGVIAHVLTLGALPELDEQKRPKVFFGDTIHDRCYRRPFYDQGKFAKTFDDEGARNGWCLFELGCKGPVTRNACATLKWNGGASFPIESGHPCLGCSEPNFWDAGDFYRALPEPAGKVLTTAAAAVAAGAVIGIAAGAIGRRKKAKAAAERKPVTSDDLK